MKVLCPRHEDTNPSVEVYPDGAFCFVCSVYIPHEELKLDKKPGGVKYVENVYKSLRRIRALPLSTERGVPLAYDERGLYVLFPGENYYKLRLHVKPEKGDRYRSPAGHPAPLYVARELERRDLLVIVEGEINSASIAEAVPEVSVVSPGGCGNFDQKFSDRFRHFYEKYERALVITDKDAPGAIAAMNLSSYLQSFMKMVVISLWEQDANQILMDDGKEKLREKVLAEISKVEMPSRVQGD